MKVYRFCYYILFLSRIINGQSLDASIEDVINQTNLDSLINNVRILTGEDSVKIDSTMYLIEHRVDAWGNELAADFIKQTLEKLNLEVIDQYYSGSGRNIIAVQPGYLYPDKQFIICAHYDAVDYFCADDNASGTACVLESARILSKLESEYTLIYAFWDEEETNLGGSRYFASQADSGFYNLQGVINVDMIGWDGNNDGLFDIHTKNIARSNKLAQFMVDINSLYDFQLQPVVYNPGTIYSDHSPFWDTDVSSILLIEAFYGDELNPFYHTPKDRIGKFNTSYFHKLSKLAIATISSLVRNSYDLVESLDGDSQDINSAESFILFQNYPNPFNTKTMINYQLSMTSEVDLSIYNMIGQKMVTLVDKKQQPGSYKVQWDAANHTSGVYLYKLSTENFMQTRKLLLLK